MAALQATFGLTTLSSNGTFAVYMICFSMSDLLNVAFTSFAHRGSHQDLRLRASRVWLLLRAVWLRLWHVKAAMSARRRLMSLEEDWPSLRKDGVNWAKSCNHNKHELLSIDCVGGELAGGQGCISSKKTEVSLLRDTQLQAKRHSCRPSEAVSK